MEYNNSRIRYGSTEQGERHRSTAAVYETCATSMKLLHIHPEPLPLSLCFDLELLPSLRSLLPLALVRFELPVPVKAKLEGTAKLALLDDRDWPVDIDNESSLCRSIKLFSGNQSFEEEALVRDAFRRTRTDEGAVARVDDVRRDAGMGEGAVGVCAEGEGEGESLDVRRLELGGTGALLGASKKAGLELELGSGRTKSSGSINASKVRVISPKSKSKSRGPILSAPRVVEMSSKSKSSSAPPSSSSSPKDESESSCSSSSSDIDMKFLPSSVSATMSRGRGALLHPPLPSSAASASERLYRLTRVETVLDVTALIRFG